MELRKPTCLLKFSYFSLLIDCSLGGMRSNDRDSYRPVDPPKGDQVLTRSDCYTTCLYFISLTSNQVNEWCTVLLIIWSSQVPELITQLPYQKYSLFIVNFPLIVEWKVQFVILQFSKRFRLVLSKLVNKHTK